MKWLESNLLNFLPWIVRWGAQWLEMSGKYTDVTQSCTLFIGYLVAAAKLRLSGKTNERRKHNKLCSYSYRGKEKNGRRKQFFFSTKIMCKIFAVWMGTNRGRGVGGGWGAWAVRVRMFLIYCRYAQEGSLDLSTGMKGSKF